MQRTHIESTLKGFSYYLKKKKCLEKNIYIYNCIIKSTFSLILRLRRTPPVDHVRFIPVRSSRISQQKRLFAVYLKTRTC